MRTDWLRILALTTSIGLSTVACGGRVTEVGDGSDTPVSADGSRDVIAPIDGGTDAPPFDEMFPDVPPPKDVFVDDVTDVADDVVEIDVGPPVDVTPPDDVITVDTPLPTDVPPPLDVPAIDVVDVPSPIDAATCPWPTVRALSLPTDSVMRTVTGMGRNANTSCATTGGPDELYTLHVDARTGVQLSTTTNFDTVLAIRSVCDTSMGELACDDDVPGSTASRIRTVLDPGDYYVVVDQYGGTGGMGGMYTLDLTSFTPASNATCSAADTLTAGTTITGDVRGGLRWSTACLNGNDGAQLFYSLTIPAGQRATVTATPTGSPAWSATVRALADCTATTCTAFGTSPMAGAPAVETIDNRGTAPMTVIVSVSASNSTTGGTFDLAVSFSTPPAPPANASCATPTPVTNGTMLTGQDASLATGPLTSACLATARGNVLYYSITVPSRNTLALVATPRSNWDPVIRVVSSCTATSCLASNNANGANQAERLNWYNAAATSQDVIIAVGSNDLATSGQFDLSVALLAPPANNTCATATPVVDGTRLTMQNSGAGTENATAACASTLTGAVLYYSATIAPGSTLTANVTPIGTMDAVIRLLPACGATSCLANTNVRGAGGAEQLTYVNTGTADQSVILAIGGASNATNGLFDLSIGIVRDYTETMIAGACDVMTGATPVAGPTGDDTVSALIDLPFTFHFYGESETEFSVSSNGIVQLWPSLAGMGSNSYNNVAIPTAGAPDRFLAPFWDDLFPDATTTTVSNTFGTAPNRHYTIEWGATTIFADRTARLTFQVKLFEGTDVIEFHYCTLTPGTMAGLATGGSATIGIEGPTGTRGHQHSFNTMGSIDTANALRYTP